MRELCLHHHRYIRLCYHLIRRYDTCRRQERLTTNEYILIHVICSSGMMGYFVIGFLTAFSSPVPVHMFLVSRILSLLETFLQTYLFAKTKTLHNIGKHFSLHLFYRNSQDVKESNILVFVFVQLILPYHRSRHRLGR